LVLHVHDTRNDLSVRSRAWDVHCLIFVSLLTTQISFSKTTVLVVVVVAVSWRRKFLSRRSTGTFGSTNEFAFSILAIIIIVFVAIVVFVVGIDVSRHKLLVRRHGRSRQLFLCSRVVVACCVGNRI
jgi:hypothetical protein